LEKKSFNLVFLELILENEKNFGKIFFSGKKKIFGKFTIDFGK